jgi:phosphate transport system substrate-binding protein
MSPVLFALLACGPGHKDQPETEAKPAERVVIQDKGSDTMVNVAQAWAEKYAEVRPQVAVAVSGGGSGTGIAALENGTADIANASRDLKPEEAAKVREHAQKDPVTHVVAFDALAVFVHKDNPIAKLTKEDLAGVYGEGGTKEKWTDLGVTIPGCADQAIVRISRQNNSGSYEYFREWTMGKGDFKLGSRDMQGGKDVAEAVGTTPCAIGYSGMGFKTDAVRFAPVAGSADAAGVEPSTATVLDKSYPLSRSLYMITAGEAQGETARYLQWIRSDAGQALVEAAGLVPLPAAERPPAPQ